MNGQSVKEKPKGELGFEARARITAQTEIDKFALTHVVGPAVKTTIEVAVNRLVENPYSTIKDVRQEVRDILKNEGKIAKIDMPVARKAEGKGFGEAQIIMQLTGDLNNYGLSLTDREFNQVVDYVKSKNPKSHEELISRIDAGLGLIGYGRKTLDEQRQTVDTDRRIAKLTGYKGPGDYGVSPGVRELEPTSVVAKAETASPEKQTKHEKMKAARAEAKAATAREAEEAHAKAADRRAAETAATAKREGQRKADLLARREEHKKADAEAAAKKAAEDAAKSAQKAEAAELAQKEKARKEEEKAAKRRGAEVARAEPGTAGAAKREEILAKILGGLKTGAALETSAGSNKEELERQIRGEGVAKGDAKGALTGPAEKKGKEEIAEIEQLRLKGGDAEVKTGEGKEAQVAFNAPAPKSKKKEPGVAEFTPSAVANLAIDAMAVRTANWKSNAPDSVENFARAYLQLDEKEKGEFLRLLNADLSARLERRESIPYANAEQLLDRLRQPDVTSYLQQQRILEKGKKL